MHTCSTYVGNVAGQWVFMQNINRSLIQSNPARNCKLAHSVALRSDLQYEAESGDVWMGGDLCGRPPRFVDGGSEEVFKDVAWIEVRSGWKKEVQKHLKLEMVRSLMEQECECRGMMVKCKRRRRKLVKLRGGMAELGVETGRWRGVRREERICKNCKVGEVEVGAQQRGQNVPRGTTAGCLEAGSHNKCRVQVLATWMSI